MYTYDHKYSSKSVVVCTNHIYIHLHVFCLYDMLNSFNRGGVKHAQCNKPARCSSYKSAACMRLLNNIVPIL